MLLVGEGQWRPWRSPCTFGILWNFGADGRLRAPAGQARDKPRLRDFHELRLEWRLSARFFQEVLRLDISEGRFQTVRGIGRYLR